MLCPFSLPHVSRGWRPPRSWRVATSSLSAHALERLECAHLSLMFRKKNLGSASVSSKTRLPACTCRKVKFRASGEEATKIYRKAVDYQENFCQRGIIPKRERRPSTGRS